MAADPNLDRPWRSNDVVLLVANLVYATSYVAARLTLDDVPPATLAFVRCGAGAALLVAGLSLTARSSCRNPRPSRYTFPRA